MPRRQTPRLSEALTKYMTNRAHLAATTQQNDGLMLAKFCREVGDVQVHQLTAPIVEDWFGLEASRTQASSYNKTRARVAQFCRFLQRRGWLDDDPMEAVPRRRVSRPERRRLTARQLRQLIEQTTNERDRIALAVGANLALRASDIIKLQVGDVDLDQGLVHVRTQKTGDEDYLPITSDLERELRRWLTYYAERLQMLGMPIQPDMLLVPALGHNFVRCGTKVEKYGDPKPYTRVQSPAKIVHRALTRIGVTELKGEGFHSLRRSTARLLFDQASDAGHDGALRITAALLQHRDVATTQTYLGVSADRRRRDELLRGRSLLGSEATDATVTPLRVSHVTG